MLGMKTYRSLRRLVLTPMEEREGPNDESHAHKQGLLSP